METIDDKAYELYCKYVFKKCGFPTVTEKRYFITGRYTYYKSFYDDVIFIERRKKLLKIKDEIRKH